MTGWNDSWADVVSWFHRFASEEAYAWAAFFAPLVHELSGRSEAEGLYAHRWATSVVVSRFGEPDWQIGPTLVLMPLPGDRIEVVVNGPHSSRLSKAVHAVPFDLAELDLWLRFIAGEASP